MGWAGADWVAQASPVDRGTVTETEEPVTETEEPGWRQVPSS